MQAKYYQIKSKYYVLLKQQKEQSPVRGMCVCYVYFMSRVLFCL